MIKCQLFLIDQKIKTLGTKYVFIEITGTELIPPPSTGAEKWTFSNLFWVETKTGYKHSRRATANCQKVGILRRQILL